MRPRVSKWILIDIFFFYSLAGILDTKTGSMETLIDSASSKTINYAYTSSVIADDEFINAAAATAAPPHQRPMLPPPPLTSQDSPSPSLPNDVSLVHRVTYIIICMRATNNCNRIKC